MLDVARCSLRTGAGRTIPLVLVALALSSPAAAKICWDYASNIAVAGAAVNPQPWATACAMDFGADGVCSPPADQGGPNADVLLEDPAVDDCYNPCEADIGCDESDFLHPRGCVDGTAGDCLDGAVDTGPQTIGEEHRNWHCRNPVPRPGPITPDLEAAREAWGRAFLAFHRQFILDYDLWRLAGFPGQRLEIWDPFQNAPIPGSDETTATDFPGSLCCSEDVTRPAGALCAGCVTLPAKFTVAGGLGTNFTSLGWLGYTLEIDRDESPPDHWHRGYHTGVAAVGCDDLSDVLFTPCDPAFWLAHNKLDEVAREWLSQQAADVVIVLDTSGSMDDDCTSSSPPLGETDCKINDAREAARTFADVVLDDRGPGLPDHRVALVSFDSTAVPEHGLTAADSLIGGAFETQLDALTAGGATSIGAGVREALDILSTIPDPNPHQAILVLSDGKENTAPCLDGADDPRVGAGDDCVDGDEITLAELGSVHVAAIGVGAGAVEWELRTLAEQQGGAFFALEDSSSLDLQKFFVLAMGEIYDAGVMIDPKAVMKAGRVASEPFDVPVCGGSRLSLVLGQKPVGERDPDRTCDLALELTTPAGAIVDRSHPGVEAGHGERHDFLHVALPYEGESRGTWRGRVVRPQGRECAVDQEYFWSTLSQGQGRVDPWVVRPDVVVGQEILATFRIAEPQRPRDGFDGVAATARLTRPDGTVESLPLVDDGTAGDAIAGNHLFTAVFPPATEAGPHRVQARFELTDGGCSEVREAEFALTVAERPERCVVAYTPANLGGYSFDRPQPGDRLRPDHLVCIRNACAEEDRYTIEITDSLGWLATEDAATGALGPAPGPFTTAAIPAFGKRCDLADGRGLVVQVPPDAPRGTATEISIRIASETHPGATFAIDSSVRAYPPSDCNANGVGDREEIAGGAVADENGNRVPDECEGGMAHPMPVDADGGQPGDGEPGDGEPGDGEPGDGEPGDGEPGGGEPEPGGGLVAGCGPLLIVLLVVIALGIWWLRRRRAS